MCSARAIPPMARCSVLPRSRSPAIRRRQGENPMADVIVGIDLGTTNSEVAALVDGNVQVLAADGEQIMPSFVGLSPEGTPLVGTPARNQYVIYPERTVKSIKRLMGSGERG